MKTILSRGSRTAQSGLNLVEVMIAGAVLTIVFLGVVQMFASAQRTFMEQKEQTRASRIARTVHSQIQDMKFFDIFSCDSSKTDFGLAPIAAGGLHSSYYAGGATPFSSYPSSGTLLAMQKAVKDAGFNHFDIGVTYLRRDLSAVRVSTQTSNLIAFVDSPIASPPPSLAAYTMGDGVDDYDSLIRYRDINGDGDYFDSFWLYNRPAGIPAGCAVFADFPTAIYCANPVAGQTPWIRANVSEMPDTRLKQVHFRLWNNKGKLVHQEGWLINFGGLSGSFIDEWESNLVIKVTSPLPPAIIYSYLSVGQQDAFNLVISKPYPDSLPAIRADSNLSLIVSGRTSPNATVYFSTNTSSLSLSTNSYLDSGVVPDTGEFSFSLPNISAALVEGWNDLGVRAVKLSRASSLWKRPFLYDTRPPILENTIAYSSLENVTPPNISVRTLTPFLGLVLKDNTSGTADVSDIAKDVIKVSIKQIGGGAFSETSWVYRDGWRGYNDNWLVLANTASGLIEPLVDNRSYEVRVEAGDKAHYKCSGSFFVRTNIINGANSHVVKPSSFPGPYVDGCDVSFPSTPNRPTFDCFLYDTRSGVNWKKIQFKIYKPGGATYANITYNPATSPRMGDYFYPDPQVPKEGGRFHYDHSSDLAAGVYRIRVKFENWKGDDFNDFWDFTVP